MLTRKTILMTAGVIALSAIACDKSNQGSPTTAEPPAPQANPAPPAPVTNTNAMLATDPLANVENRGRVTESPDEVKIVPPKTARLITGFTAASRESPSGVSIATLETVETVTEVAHDAKGNYYLIVYPDPKDPTRQLAGWVHRTALEDTGWSTLDTTSSHAALSNTMAGKLDCTKGQAHVRTDRDFCAKTCKDDKGCDRSTGEICDGLAFEVHESNNKLSTARYCIPSSSPGANAGHGPEHGPSPALK